MKVNTCGRLFFAVALLSCVISNACADFIHLIAEEKSSAILKCAAGNVKEDVKWSRKSQGTTTDILTATGDGDIRHNDPLKRYTSIADGYKSLFIRSIELSDAGLFYCDFEPAVELTVIPRDRKRQTAVEMTTVTLSCPQSVTAGSEPATWSRAMNGTYVNITEHHITNPNSRYQLSEDNSLTINEVEAADFGWYYCNSKLAAYLTLIKSTDETQLTTEKPTITTPTTKSRTPPPLPTTTTTTTTAVLLNLIKGTTEGALVEVAETNAQSGQYLAIPHNWQLPVGVSTLTVIFILIVAMASNCRSRKRRPIGRPLPITADLRMRAKADDEILL